MLLLHAAAAFQFHENKCEPKTSLPTSEDSKRIAFILRGDAYRGLSYGRRPRPRTPAECSSQPTRRSMCMCRCECIITDGSPMGPVWCSVCFVLQSPSLSV